VFLGLGLGGDSKLGASGEEGRGVWGAVDLIEHIKSDGNLKLDGVQRAIVVGGGNTAIDIAHELSLLGVPDVVMVYRRVLPWPRPESLELRRVVRDPAETEGRLEVPDGR
jgi:glutamate synthase (NADPH/NADH) small chain